jgi:hypothetical protein
MPNYTNLQSILNAALGPYQAKGFRLVEEGDHCVFLYHRDELVARFSQMGATIPVIHKTCEAWLTKIGEEVS